jgi:Na+/H+ antiporter NhaD/arsenite permease-like protein
VAAAAVLAVVIVLDREVISRADYILLLTFIGFFIFTGNMARIESVHSFLSEIIEGRVLLVSVISSQFISNVPSALLLSDFTNNYKELLLGVNFGGLGTLIASMASLISYKEFGNEFPQEKAKYLLYFTFVNVVFLFALILLLTLPNS